ncbi:Hypothetical protein I595_2717 [Croceitalea dokdonensis DOKDO 023]|uniref:Carboxypeptidase-like regulatory domain-containing protein n=2 Tax=Croceitalea TaxID=574891 RepID=A0A0P7AST8_9FLAO|nr:Hypothetical protein I595_2717 [Croceitalea dokdonensis DOKDO 023]
MRQPFGTAMLSLTLEPNFYSMKHLLVFALLLLSNTIINAQNKEFNARVIDAKTKKPVAYATVQFGENSGVITNEEGLFSFVMDTTKTRLDSVYISSMGYQKQGFSLDQATDSLLFITPKTIELTGVYLFNKELGADEIMETMIAKLPINCNRDPIKQRYFLRQSIYGTIEKADFGFEKSSIEELDKSFIDSIQKSIPKRTSYYTETLGNLYKNDKEKKIEVIKAAELYNKNAIGSFEDLAEKLENIFKNNVKPDSYLKIKSGIFSQKIQVDSIMTELEAEEARELEKEMGKDTISGVVSGQRFIFKELLGELFFTENTKLNVVDKTRKYEFSLAGYTDIDAQGVYIINFEPKGSADFRGRFFINIDDFGVMRIEFENVKNLRNFRLLGIFYKETLYSGTMQFTKLSNNKYDLKFANLNFGRWFRIDRPLDVIEKNKNVKGKRKQNELRLNLDFRTSNTNRWELVVFENELIPPTVFDGFEEENTKQATYMPTYNPEFWQGYTIMEPNQAIKNFTANGTE